MTFGLRLGDMDGDMDRLPDGTRVVVVRAKAGTSPARAMAHEERRLRNLVRFELEKLAALPADDHPDGWNIRIRVPL